MTVAQRLTNYIHPRLAALTADPGGEAGFWEEVAQARAPLIEADPERPGHSCVTYVFPAPEGARHVVVNAGFGQATDHVMARISGTNVCHASYRYRNDVRTSYSFEPDRPLLSFDTASKEEIAAAMAYFSEHPALPDPHHRDHFASRAGQGRPDHLGSFLALPDAPDESLVHKRPNVAHGNIQRHAFKSEVMGNERRVWVYTPPGYEAGLGSYPVLVAFDGGAALTSIPVQRILDNLLADGRIRPMVAVLIDNPTDTSRNDELPCNETFARCIEEELLPWLRANYSVSHAASDHYVTGVSYGGLASMWLGYRLPHIFGNVISQAASLWWGPGWDTGLSLAAQNFAPEWLIEQYAAAPRLPVRFWMEIGLMEHPSRMLVPNRRMRAVLEEKGYELIYSEPNGGHDSALWRGTLATALGAMAPAPA
jgi:enterochelin esterase family protein